MNTFALRPTLSRADAGPNKSRQRHHALALLGAALLVFGCLAAPPAPAADPDATVTPPMSFERAATLLAARSDALAGARESIEAAQDKADSLKHLRWPNVSLDAQELRYQKTFELSLGGLKTQAGASAAGVLDGIETTGVPGVSTDAVDSVIAQVHSALPGVFASIPDSVSLTSRRTLFHPTVTAILPLYAGGAISAMQRGAKAAATATEARAEATRQALQLNLVQAYFGQVLAARTLSVARATRDGFDAHLANARKLQRAGQLSHAQTLQVEVARDASQRALDEAEGASRTATDTLENLLHSNHPIDATTPLFVSSTPLKPVDQFVAAAEAGQPRLREADAAVDAARQGVRAARAAWLPTLFAFGSYNLNRHHELVTEPDWVVGVGLHYSLMSSTGRHSADSAARARQRAAEALERQARVDLRTAVTRAWNLTETARRQFLTLDSSQASARASLRAEEISFREGVATATDLIDARNALAAVETRRAAAAYKYDLALASLLLAAGRSDTFSEYLRAADVRVTTDEGN